MTVSVHMACRLTAMKARLRDDSGAAMVEFALVCALFFFIFFTLIDFGRLAYTFVFLEKASVDATRLAVVRPIVCPEAYVGGNYVPQVNSPPDTAGSDHPRSGTSCDATPPSGGSTCASLNFSCNVGTAGISTNDTVVEIWKKIGGLMPPGADPNDMTFDYTFDPRLGYLGGPYTPVVTVTFDLPDFQFVSPLAGLGALASGQASTGGGTWSLAYPDFSVSLPAEDLRHGAGG